MWTAGDAGSDRRDGRTWVGFRPIEIRGYWRQPSDVTGSSTRHRPRQLTAEPLYLYAGDWAHFQNYCAKHGEVALPASPELVSAFLAASGSGRAAPARRLAVIDHQHRRRRHAPLGVEPNVRTAPRNARRAGPGRPRPTPQSALEWQRPVAAI
ncbi:MAG: hypothetical protein ACRYG8_21830 [Janthinobacterium lividum]